MAGLWESLNKQLQSWPGQLVLGLAILALLVAVSYFVLRRLRGSAVGNFREMKLQGDISDKEFRTIKALLNEKQAPTIKQNQDNT
jgi:hypothetical protein